MLQPVDRQRHPLRREQEQLLAPQVPARLVDGGPERGVMQVDGLAPGATRIRAPAAASLPSSRSRYQRIARGQANSPSSTGLSADQGRWTVSRG